MSLTQMLEYEISTLKVSDPVFKVRKESGGWQGTRLVLEPIARIGYELDRDLQATNPLRALAIKHHHEQFDTNSKRFIIHTDAILERCRQEIKTYIITFIKIYCSDNLELYKWYEYYALSTSNMERTYFEPLLGIYKYLSLNAQGDDVEKHKTNAVAILDLIFQRDYKEHQMPQRKRRRRRRK